MGIRAILDIGNTWLNMIMNISFVPGFMLRLLGAIGIRPRSHLLQFTNTTKPAGVIVPQDRRERPWNGILK